jgi:hypothetical protein
MAIPQVADGGGYQTTLLLMNTSDKAETGFIRFYGTSGSDLPMRMTVGGAADSKYPYSIPAGGFLRLVTDGSPSNASAGWARVVPDSGNSTPVSAAIFSFTQRGVLVTETGVSASSSTTHARIYLDKSGGHDTGLALANPNSAGIHVTATVYQSDGTMLAGTGSSTVDLAPMGHNALFAGELIAGLPDGFTGVLDLASSSPFSALTLRSLTNGRGDFLVTMFPTADINLLAPAPLIFPQIANGGGYQTQIILLDASGAASTVTLKYLGDTGAPISVIK